MSARVATAGLAGAIPAGLAFASGGYFPSEWGFELLALGLIVLGVVALGGGIALGRLDAAVLLGLTGLAAWTLLSIAWSPGVDEPVLAAERALVYATGAAALLFGLARERVEALLLGLVGGVVVVALHGLETRLLEGRVGSATDLVSGSRLVDPIGYANALGALAAIGLVLALGLATTSRSRAVRAACAAALAPLATALYLTLSRGSLLAAALGVVLLGAPARRRSLLARLLPVIPAPALGVLLAQRSTLTRAGLDSATARSAGHTLAWELALLALLGAGAGMLVERVGRRFERLARAAGLALAVVAVAAVSLAGPVRLVDRARDRLQAPPPVGGGDLNRRVLSISGSGRTDYWHVAWRMVERRPLLGEGGGSYERWWLQERPVASYARNAHSLYLETLAELGPLGLTLLLTALGAPLVALRGRTGDPLVPVAIAAYAVWLAHAALDWDWQIPSVTLVGLACGFSVVVLARPERSRERPRRGSRALALGVVSILLGAALVVHVGNRTADAAASALARGDDSLAAAEARKARSWMPWAGQPWQLLGEAQLARHEDAGARGSLRRALDRDPSSWSIWYDLATVTTGRERAEALRRARELNPLAAELAGLH